MKYIDVGLLSFRNLYPVFASLSFTIRRYTSRLMISNNRYLWDNKPLFHTFVMFLSELFIGLFDCSLYSVTIKRPKNATIHDKRYIPDFFKLIKPKQAGDRVQNYSAIFFITLLEGGSFYSIRLINVINRSTIKISDEARCTKLIFDSAFCYFFFNYKVQRHHYVSIILLIIGITLSFVPEFQKDVRHYYYIFFYFFINASLSFSDCLEKGLMDNKFYNPLRLLFLKGLIGSITTLSMLIVMKSAKCSMRFCEDIFEISTILCSFPSLLMYFALYFICSGLYNLFCNLIKAHFNTTFLSVADCSSLIIWTLVLEVFNQKNISSLGYIISGMLLIFVGCVVYNEIVIIYCCGLHMNTKKEISRRSNQEDLLSVHQLDFVLIEDTN